MSATGRQPLQPTRLIGRDADLATAVARLADPDVRLLTLTGPPGVGKTRLAIEAASRDAGEVGDGAVFVDLAPLADPALVPSVIARSLGLEESGGGPVIERLTAFLRNKHILIVLDNFEHLLAAAPMIADLLAACAGLRLVVTSRVPLGLRWERTLEVPPLEQPRPDDPLDQGTLAGVPAVALFLDRAWAARAEFALTADNAEAVAGIVRRLDGLPLAIELAAARMKVLVPERLLRLLDRPLAVLSGGIRDLPVRQRSVRDTIAWSYALLDESARALFRALGVFAGGSTFEAVAAVAGFEDGEPGVVLDGLATLLDAHLLRMDDRAPTDGRYRMLETVRAYAAERLDDEGEGDALRGRMAAFLLELAREAEPRIKSGERETWLTRLDDEIDNVRAALTWCLNTPAALATGVRLAATLDMYWHFRDHWREARDWLARLLAAGELHLEPTLLAEAYCVLGRLAVFLRDPHEAQTSLDRSLQLARDCDNRRTEAYALLWLARLARDVRDHRASFEQATQMVEIFRTLDEPWALALALGYLGDPTELLVSPDAARVVLGESVKRFRQLGDEWGTAFSLDILALVLERAGDVAGARRAAAEALQLRRTAGVKYALAASLMNHANLLYADRDFAGAVGGYDEAVALRRAQGISQELAFVLRRRGSALFQMNRPSDAVTSLKESLHIFHERGDAQQAGLTLAAIAAVAAATGDRATAAALAATAELTVNLALVRLPIERDDYVRNLASARTDDAPPDSRSPLGGPWSLDDAVDRALRFEPLRPTPRRRAPRDNGLPDRLSGREGEVLTLLAAGRSNREIAETLVLSVRTVEKHVARIYAKIDAHGRAGATIYAVRHGIASPEPPGSPDTT